VCSLYPSVICGYKLCFRNVVYDKRWLEDPRATVMYVPLNDTEAVAFITHYDNVPVDTITDKITAVLMEERKRIRTEMKSVTDPFKLTSMEAAQLCCKVMQNSCYGQSLSHDIC
jgi:DNA polymerase elongation subunit (family B)